MGWHNPPIPWRDFEKQLSWKSGNEPGGRPQDLSPPRRDPSAARRPDDDRQERRPDAPAWAELHVHSSYSFLDGASDPASLVREAARLGVEAMAITDHDGMYGAVQFAQAAAERNIGTIFGAELSLGLPGPQTGEPDPAGQHLLILARGAEGYGRLCTEITRAQLAGRQKGRPIYDLEKLADAHDDHWAVLTGCRKGAVPSALEREGIDAAERELTRLVEMFGADNVFVELVDHDLPDDDHRNDALFELATRTGLATVASNNVHFASPGGDARLAQALAAVRSRRSLDDMVGWLPASGTAHIRDGAEMAARLARFPGVHERTVELARSCIFNFKVVAPSLPDWPDPQGLGRSEAEQLRQLVREGALKRYGPPNDEKTPGAHAQIAKELDVIEGLDFPGYFLIVHDIVRACEERNILCQGRGSAANSAVCYALGITGVDAVKHGLLFERFLSPGRDGPPDIDLDIEHRRREEIIQYVYEKYGRECTAQVANVIQYRPRMAVRDSARALGFSPGQQDAWSKGIDPRDPVGAEAEIPTAVTELAEQMLKLPRHLGIHSGGMVIADRPVGSVCPIEWATMPKRSVLQWDKDDCAAAGLVKFDLLGLGMLAALHDTFDLVAEYCGERYDLQSIPHEDPLVYDMLCDADTVGVFQVESRAQMATLPRLRPRKFYDLVVEVALIRPGPIQGGSVHPYLRRRKGKEDPTCPHPLMQKSLARTLGVPLFQEQMMQLAVDCAGFSAAESDQLRQAMGAKRAPERVERLRKRLLEGMAERDIPADVAEDIYQKILGFTGFGFPESHAQSFAHLVYASSWLKRHHPAAFTAALVRNQPMGFYNTQSLYADARRHGVEVRPVDINASGAHPTLEDLVPVESKHPHAPGKPQPAIRMGLTGIRNLGDDVAEAIADGRPYTSMEDLARRIPLSSAALEALATAGAFDNIGVWGSHTQGRGQGLSRREALWAAGALAGTGPGQLEGVAPGATAPELPPMTPVEETLADLWATGVSHTHPMSHVREALDELGALSSERLATRPGESNVVVAGLVTHRQRPPTAGGIVFMTLEDETGIINVTCPPQVFQRHRGLAVDSQALLVNGRLERADGVSSVRATRLRRLPVPGKVRSRNFH
ncbi:error-prone DNA polymerase [Actinomadura barringtoniae]|uniref:Error-prone DNA polymerase n=1 Tax=Actinomadura barringtoniae TaxID=1427535 RepID=A0A939PPV2_9ACTN|nr:error-prone DNA polymerase [Actinomadura barringtoniae]MBO2455938.1 error-prone DNA polymerase [Actinomadura barringtoniae]